MNDQRESSAVAWSAARRWAGGLLGAGLLAGSVAAAVGGLGGAAPDWSAVAEAPGWAVGLVLVCMGANVLLSGLTYSLATWPAEMPGRPVPVRIMIALVAASSLLNYLPLRAGLFGRAVFLRRYYDVAVHYSMMVAGAVMAVSGVLYALVFAAGLYHWSAALAVMAGGAGLCGAGAMGTMAAARRELAGRCSGGEGQGGKEAGRGGLAWHQRIARRHRNRLVLFAASGLRLVELLVTTVRLAAVLVMVGAAGEGGGGGVYGQAVLLAAGGMFVTLASLTPNGLGLREWLYGLLVAAGLVGQVGGQGGLSLGLQVALVDRAAEVLVVVPAGLAGLAVLRQRVGAVAACGRP